MKEQIQRLEQANEQKNTQHVIEAISAIEAYCQLFKNDNTFTRVDRQQPPVEKVVYPSYQQIQTSPSPETAVVQDHRGTTKNNEGNLGNLLDF